MSFKNIDGDTGGVSCVFTPGANEKCDDGANNGKYGTTTSGKSHCKDDCTGRIGVTTSKPNGEYFCGDGVVQYKSNETCTGLNCKPVTETNYPGATPSGSNQHHSDFTTSEECDPSDTLNSRNALCNRKLGLNRNDYYDQGSISCGEADDSYACKITGVVSDKTSSSYPCGYCGDNEVNGSEQCDGSDLSCSGETKEYDMLIGTKTWNFDTAYQPEEIIEVRNNIYYIGWTDSTMGDYGLLYYQNGNGNNYSYYDYWYYNSGSSYKYPNYPYYSDGYQYTGWTRQSVNGHTAYCSNSAGMSYSMADLVLTVNTSQAGTLSFDYYGESESGSKGDKMHDGMVFYFDKNSTYNGSNRLYNVDLIATGTMSSWTTKTINNVSQGSHTLIFRYFKDDGANSGIDKFCIDNIKFQGSIPATTNNSTLSCSNCQKTGTCYSYCGDATTDKNTNGDLVFLTLDEGSGSTTANSGSLGGSYSVSGGSWTAAGKHGQAYTFNGSGGYIETANLKDSNYTDNFTMMAWVKPSASIYMPSGVSNSDNVAGNSHHFVFGAVPGHGSQPNPSAGWAGAGVSVGTNGVFVTAHTDNFFARLAYSNISLGSQWHHVAVVFTNKIPRIYIDGADKTTSTISTAPNKTIFPSYQIGGGQSTYGNFNGTIDDVRILAKILSAAEIKNLMASAGEACDDGSDNNNDAWSQNAHCNGTCSGYAPHCGDGVINGPETCEAGTRQHCNAGCSGCGCSDKYKWRECKSDCTGWGSWSGESTSYHGSTYGTYIGDC